MSKTKELVNLYEKSLRDANKSINTIIAYTKDIEQFLEFCENVKNKKLNEITNEDVQAYVDHYTNKGYTLKSIYRKLNAVKNFFKFAIENNYANSIPQMKIRSPKAYAEMPRVLTPEEYNRLRKLAKRDVRIYTMVELLLQTGMRVGELCRIELDDIIYQGDKPIQIRIKKYESTPERIVPLNDVASSVLKEYLSIRPKYYNNPALFLTKSGNPVMKRNVRFYLESLFKKANIKNATVNDLRNTFIAHHLARGASISFIASVVGHKRISTTERFANLIGINKPRTEKLESL